MKRVRLTRGRCALVDDADYETMNQYRWAATPIGNIWYAGHKAYRTKPLEKRKWILMHRLILGVSDGTVKVDHINGNGLDNRRSNLRFASNQQNGMNSKKRVNNLGAPARSKYKGVYWEIRKNCWRARIKANGVRLSLGHHKTEESAAKAYDEAALKHFGEFAFLNFPKQNG